MLSIEFMLLFLLCAGLVSLLAEGMLGYGREAGMKMEEARLALAAEGKARAFETAYRDGILIKPIDARVEDALLIDFGDKVIQSRGVFVHDRAEPL